MTGFSTEIGGNADATCFGGVAAVHRLVTKLGLPERINEQVPLLKVHLPYHESDHIPISCQRCIPIMSPLSVDSGQSPDDTDQDGGGADEPGQPAPADSAGGRWRARLARACAEHVRLGPTTLLLYDVTTLYFETDEGDGFREPGFSKERRLEPQITVGLLTDGSGFPLMVHAFEGNRAETTTMVPVLRAFLDAHSLSDVTVVADAGMVSEANKRAIEATGLSFILGARVADVPYVVTAWRDAHPDIDIPDGHVFVQPWPAGPADKRRDHTIFHQYRADRARRRLHGIDAQVAKAENAVAGKTAVNATGTCA